MEYKMRAAAEAAHGALDACPTDGRQPEVVEQMKELGKALMYVDDMLTKLMVRMEPVISPRPPMASESMAKRQVSAPLAIMLAEHVNKTVTLAERIRALTAAIEV
jgi:hypothetical protein